MNIYIKIRTDFEFWLKCFIYFLLITDVPFFFILPIKYNHTFVLRAILALITFLLFFYIMLVGDYRERVLRKYAYVATYCYIIIPIMCIIFLYSILKYDQTIFDVFYAGQYYFSLITVPSFLLLFEIKEDEFNTMLKAIAIIGIICTLITVFNGFGYAYGSTSIFQGITLLGMRNGHIRIGYRTFSYYSIFYYLTDVLKEKCSKRFLKICYVAIALFGMFYFVSTRMISISMVIAIAAIFVFFSERKGIKYTAIVVILIAVFYMVFNNKIDEILSIFSIESELGSSTIARLNAIEYFSSYTKDNPLMGMGIVRPNRTDLMLIFSGPTGTSYFDDLGLMGGFYKLGILGLIIHLLPLFRMLFLCIKIYRYKLPLSSLIIGIMAFILVSQVSLNYLDFQRVVIASFYWAMMEYYYRKKKDEIDNENNHYSRALAK